MSEPDLAGLIDADGGPVFAEPWQAQAFALAVELDRQGVFSLSEWSSALGAHISAAKGDGEYYEHWLTALESILAAKRLADPAQLADLRSAWARAYRDTPHGMPVTLPDPPPALPA